MNKKPKIKDESALRICEMLMPGTVALFNTDSGFMLRPMTVPGLRIVYEGRAQFDKGGFGVALGDIKEIVAALCHDGYFVNLYAKDGDGWKIEDVRFEPSQFKRWHCRVKETARTDRKMGKYTTICSSLVYGYSLAQFKSGKRVGTKIVGSSYYDLAGALSPKSIEEKAAQYNAAGFVPKHTIATLESLRTVAEGWRGNSRGGGDWRSELPATVEALDPFENLDLGFK